MFCLLHWINENTRTRFHQKRNISVGKYFHTQKAIRKNFISFFSLLPSLMLSFIFIVNMESKHIFLRIFVMSLVAHVENHNLSKTQVWWDAGDGKCITKNHSHNKILNRQYFRSLEKRFLYKYDKSEIGIFSNSFTYPDNLEMCEIESDSNIWCLKHMPLRYLR